MADTIQIRRGAKNKLPKLAEAEFGLARDTEEVFIGGQNRNIPVLTLKSEAGGPLGIDKAATAGSNNLITSGAVYQAMQNAGGGSGEGGGGASYNIDNETLILANGVLKVNTADVVEQDNTLPVTSAAVQVTVGNIEALLQTI